MGKITKIPTAGMSREDWLEERRKSLGGSDMGAILGLNKWRSPYTVWADKRGLLPPEEDSEAMRIGRDLEPYVLSRFTEASGIKTRNVKAILRNSDFPHLHANVDSMCVGIKAGVEAKTASALNEKYFTEDTFPNSYYAQCVAYLAVTEAERWYLVALIMGRGLRIYQLTRIENDTCPEWCECSVYVPQEEIDALNAEANAFWSRVERMNPPPTDETKSTSATLDAIYKADPEAEVDLDGMRDDVAGLLAITERIKALEEVASGYKSAIKDAMREATRGTCELANFTWREQTRRSLDTDRLRADYPSLDLKKYYNISKSRVFRFTPAKKGD